MKMRIQEIICVALVMVFVFVITGSLDKLINWGRANSPEHKGYYANSIEQVKEL